MLADRLPQEPETDSVLDRMRREIARIESSVTELAHFAEPPRPVLQQRNLHQLIDRTLSRAALGATTRVNRDYDPRVGVLSLDERLLGEALRRVFVNAREAMPSGGTLSIVTSWREGRVVVTVRDTGSGIDDSQLPLVFEPFFSAKTRGLGLGLAITRRFVEAHGGSVSARPSAASGGAELVVELPDPTISGRSP